MRTILLSILVLCFAVTTSAQYKNTSKLLKLANAEYAQLRYAYAIPLFKEYLNLKSNDTAAIFKLANSYKISNQYDSALKYFASANENGANVGNSLAEIHASKGAYTSAVNAYTKLSANALNEKRKNGFQNIDQFKRDSLDYTLHYLSINTSFNEYAVTPTKDGIIFESNRASRIKGSNEFGWDGSAFSKLYKTKTLQATSAIASIKWLEKTATLALSDLTAETSNDNSSISRKYDFNTVSYNANGVTYIDEALNNKYNAGAICFTTDTNTAYFTRNQERSKGVYTLEIWSTTKVGGKWANFTRLSFNTANASYAHPAITKDGNRLYFISDIGGGLGGTDLYFVEKDAQGNWSSPINAGDKVNTIANELYPTMSEGNLYISSNGHVGMGGLDIYKVVMNNGQPMGVLNLAYPVNGNGDDMSFYRNNKKGYFVSNRFGTDDIFSYDVEIAKITLNGKVTVSDGSENGPVVIKLYPTSILSPFAKAHIVPTNEPNEIEQSMQASADGSYTFKVRPNRKYTIEAIEPKGNKVITTINSNDYTAKANGVYEKDLNSMVMNISPLPPPPPPPAPAPVVKTRKSFNNIIDSLTGVTPDFVILNHDFDKVTIEKSYNAEYNKIIARIKKTKGARIIVISAADCKGTQVYNEKLSARRSAYISKLIKAVSKSNEIISLHVGEQILAEPCDETSNKDKQLENRYTYIFIQK